MYRTRRGRERGQALPLFAFSLVAILLAVGLAIDAGYAYAQNRDVQNSSDFAAIAGARIVGEYNVGNISNGTASTVYNAILSELSAHNASYSSASFTNGAGVALPGDIAAIATGPGGSDIGSIPATAVGVVVVASHSWRPFVLGVVGMTSWKASTTSTAVTAGQSLGGGVFPIGVQYSAYQVLPSCPVTNLSGCLSGPVTAGLLSPGNFGWLGFGDGGSHCEGVGLGMELVDNCQPSASYIGSEVNPPVDTYGCCTAVSGAPGGDRIAADTGAKASIRIDYYIANQIALWVPIWDTYNGTGNNTYVHVVGFEPLVFTNQNQGAKNLSGFAVSGLDPACPGTGNTQITFNGLSLCSAPGGAITLGATGGVRLIH